MFKKLIITILLCLVPTYSYSQVTWEDDRDASTFDIYNLTDVTASGTVGGGTITGANVTSGTNPGHMHTDLDSYFALSGDISPPQITSNQNDYNPTNLSTASTLRLNSDASRDITGLAGGADGRIIIIHNIGSYDIVLKDESASSTAANRFALSSDVAIQADSCTVLHYDSTSSRWRLLTKALAKGATLPSSKLTAGQTFLHTPTGRTILKIYNGSSWSSLMSLGTMTVYVDGGSGTDAQDNGGSSGAGAFATVQYAIDQIPGLVCGDVTIYVASGTYNENVAVSGKNYCGDYKIDIYGTLSEQTSATMDSAIQGTGATRGSITDTGAFGAYDNYLIYWTTGDEYLFIDSDTADTATVVGTWTGGTPSGNYKVYTWGSIIDGDTSTLATFTVSAGQKNVFFHFLDIRAALQYPIWVESGSLSLLEGCKFDAAPLATTHSTIYAGWNYGFTQRKSGFIVQGNPTPFFFALGFMSIGRIARCKFLNTSRTNSAIVSVSGNSYLEYRGGTVVDGNSQAGIIGVDVSIGQVIFTNAVAEGYNIIRNNATGVRAISGSAITGTANNQYSGNTADESPAGAADPAYID